MVHYLNQMALQAIQNDVQEKDVQGILSRCILTYQNPDLQSNLLNIVQYFISPNKHSLVGISYPSSSVLSFNLL